MTFSTKMKNEISRLPINKDLSALSELSAIIHMGGSIFFTGDNQIAFKITTENAAIARRIFSLLKVQFGTQTELLVRKNTQLKKNNIYSIMVSALLGAENILKKTGIIYQDPIDDLKKINYGVPLSLLKDEKNKKAYLRGAFLGGGSISDPEKTYHLEFVAYNEQYSQALCGLINSFDLSAKVVQRKNNYVIYLKEGEQIVTMLSIIQAHNALFELENIRIFKEMRNNVNRIVNCETANLSKTVNAALRQIQNIRYINKNIGIHKLPSNLREVAELRLDYEDATLKELGQMLDPPIGKSGINHRLRKIDKIAENLKIKRGEF